MSSAIGVSSNDDLYTNYLAMNTASTAAGFPRYSSFIGYNDDVFTTIYTANTQSTPLVRMYIAPVTTRPSVNFGVDTLTANCIPFKVKFRDSTCLEAQITSWDWDFGDGNSSNLQHPTHIYNDFGNHSVSLTIVDKNGFTETLTKNNYINLIGSIDGRDTSICSGQTIDLSTLIKGTPLNNLEYGISFGNYRMPSIQTLFKTSTFFVRDSNTATMCVDTTKIMITIHEQPSITGRDTIVMIGQSINLSTLLNEPVLGTLNFGTVLGIYDLPNPIFPVTTQTFIIRDSIENDVGCKDTAKIVVNIPLVDLSLVDIDGNGTPDITDPCNCFDPQNVRKSADGQTKVTLFHDFVIIHNGGFGQTWILDVINTGAVLQKNGVPIPVNTPLTDLGGGAYRLDFWHKPNIGFNASFRRLSDNTTESIGNSCQEQACIIIPTFSQWGLFIFGLLVLNLGLTIIYRIGFSIP